MLMEFMIGAGNSPLNIYKLPSEQRRRGTWRGVVIAARTRNLARMAYFLMKKLPPRSNLWSKLLEPGTSSSESFLR